MATPSDTFELGSGDLLNGRYLVRRLLRAGGMGRVYLARDRATGARVAVKYPCAALLARPDGRDRFRAEAEFTRVSADRHVIGFHDLVTLPRGIDCLVLEYANGGTLADLCLRCGRLPSETALHVVTGIARGLAAVHVAGVVHLDVKPANILFARPLDGGPGRRVLLADFGLAHKIGAVMSGGTPLYAAPEQPRGCLADPRADQYALGAILYELLTGQTPHTGTVAQVLAKKHTPVADPRTLRPVLTAGVANVVNRLLAINPANRYPDMVAVIDDLTGLAPRRRANRAQPIAA
jgi:eukaryotic-like serine/threonine-protein kinase